MNLKRCLHVIMFIHVCLWVHMKTEGIIIQYYSDTPTLDLRSTRHTNHKTTN